MKNLSIEIREKDLTEEFWVSLLTGVIEHLFDEAPETITESKHVRTLSIPPWRDDQVVATADLDSEDLARSRKRARDRTRGRMRGLVNSFNRTMMAELQRAEGYFRTVEDPKSRARKGMPKSNARAVIEGLKAALRRTYRLAYEYGIEASGVRGPVNRVITNEEIRWLKSATTHEMRYFNRLVRDIEGGRTVSSQRWRIEMYGKTLWGIYHAGIVAGHHPDTVIWWKMDREAEHCADCERLEKQSPYTKRTLPTTPRSGQTKCLSNCKCRLIVQAADPARVAEVGKRSAATVIRRLKRP